MINEQRAVTTTPAIDATFTVNPWRTPHVHRPPDDKAFAWHCQQPYYRESPLLELPALAARLGYDRIWVKDERQRWDTNSFKILGASWALHNALARRRTSGGADVRTVFAATDGNHGRAVAFLARRYDLAANIFVPVGTTTDRIRAIEAEGARVLVVDGSYDDAVALAARSAGDTGDGLLVSDTATEPADETPEWAIQGYGTLYQELEKVLPAGSADAPDLVLVQIGVGGLAAAAVRHFRTGRYATDPGPYLIGVEPTSAGCAAASVRAGRLTTITTRFDTLMVGLIAGTPSATAWDELKHGVDGYLTIGDRWCPPAITDLADAGCQPGTTGAAGCAGLLALHALRELPDRELPAARRPLLVLSEAA